MGVRRVQLGDVDLVGADAGTSPASAADGDSASDRAPRRWVSMRWSMPRIHAGRSLHERATSPAARITALAPSVTGGQSWSRSGAYVVGAGEQLVDRAVAAHERDGLSMASRRLRAATSAIARSSNDARVEARPGLQRGEDVHVGRSGASRYGSSWSVRMSAIGPALDLPFENTSAESHSPVWIFTHASYSANAPSASTWLSTIGGHAPSASTAATKLNGWPTM